METKIYTTLFILGLAYVGWYFGVYIPTVDACNAREDMAVYAVYPWGAKCTTYKEAFKYWNRDIQLNEDGTYIVQAGKYLSL